MTLRSAMSPPDAVPQWAWTAGLSVVGGVLAVVTTVLGWIGKRYIRHRDREIQELREELQDLQAQMGAEHEGVEDRVARLDDKIDRLIDEMHAR